MKKSVFFTVLGISTLLLNPVFADEKAESSLASVASRAVKNHNDIKNLEKYDLQDGESVHFLNNLNGLSLEDFLLLDEVPAGLDVVATKSYLDQEKNMQIPVNSAVNTLKAMRKGGTNLPKGIEKDIEKNPKNVASILKNNFEKIETLKFDKDKIQQDVEGEKNKIQSMVKKVSGGAKTKIQNRTGIPFKKFTQNYKNLMTEKK